jgi:hypothetical protein
MPTVPRLTLTNGLLTQFAADLPESLVGPEFQSAAISQDMCLGYDSNTWDTITTDTVPAGVANVYMYGVSGIKSDPTIFNQTIASIGFVGYAVKDIATVSPMVVLPSASNGIFNLSCLCGSQYNDASFNGYSLIIQNGVLISQVGPAVISDDLYDLIYPNIENICGVVGDINILYLNTNNTTKYPDRIGAIYKVSLDTLAAALIVTVSTAYNLVGAWNDGTIVTNDFNGNYFVVTDAGQDEILLDAIDGYAVQNCFLTPDYLYLVLYNVDLDIFMAAKILRDFSGYYAFVFNDPPDFSPTPSLFDNDLIFTDG